MKAILYSGLGRILINWQKSEKQDFVSLFSVEKRIGRKRLLKINPKNIIMKKFFLFLFCGIIFFSASQVIAQNGQVTFEEEVEFTVNHGCGDFHVFGEYSTRLSKNHLLTTIKGVATELATGEPVPFQSSAVFPSNKNGFSFTQTIVFSSKAVVHFRLHSNWASGEVKVFSKSWVNCK